jgi:hypothetical protein
MNSKSNKELYDLLSQLADNSINDQEQGRLKELLESDEERKIYLEYCELHADLSINGGSLDDLSSTNDLSSSRAITESSIVRISQPEESRSASHYIVSTLLAASILFALGTLGLIFGQSNSTVADLSIAIITEQEDATWATPTSKKNSPNELTAGEFDLKTGSVKIKLTSGASLFLASPTRIKLLDPKAVRLESGSITVDVPDQAIGFRVITNEADIVDLGTKFGVSVDQTGGTEVHVAKGVVVAKSSGSNTVVPILHGEAGRVDTVQGEVVPTPFNASRFFNLENAEANQDQLDLIKYDPLPLDSRILFLGDRVTDRETHLLLINEVFKNQGGPTPKLFNAGTSFLLMFTEEAYQNEIVPLQPTHVVLEFGTDIAMSEEQHRYTQQEFMQRITRLVDRLQADNIEVIISTGHPLNKDQKDAQSRLDGYNTFLRTLAKNRNFRLVDVDARFQVVQASEPELLANNGRWPSFDGHRQIAIALLNSLGYSDYEVPTRLNQLPMFPGVIKQWKYRFKPKDEKLTESSIHDIVIDENWTELNIPQKSDKFARRLAEKSHSPHYRDRDRGFATNLHRRDSNLEAVAFIESETDRTAYLNIGANLHSAWVNDEQVHDHIGWGGWHAGKRRIPIQLKKGMNKIVIEAHSNFFLSITDEIDWPLP